ASEWRPADLSEARAAGTPVLAPRRTGGSLAPPGVVLFEPGSPPSLARATAEVLRHPARMARRSAQPGTAPTWTAVAQRVEATYERLLAAGTVGDLESRKRQSEWLGREPSGV